MKFDPMIVTRLIPFIRLLSLHMRKLMEFVGDPQLRIAREFRIELRRLMRLWCNTVASLCIGVLLSSASHFAHAQVVSDSPSRAQEVARIVVGISSYVRWPTVRSETRICVVGNALYADLLFDLGASKSGQRMQAVKVAVDNDAMLSECHVAYIGKVTEAEREKLFALIRSRPILSIHEATPSCAIGSMFCLKFHEAEISFEVDLDAVARSGLRVHPNVLLLAKRKTQTL